MSFRKPTLIAGTVLLVASAMAFGQGVPNFRGGTMSDPSQLPAFKGNVMTFTLTPRGDIDGFVLADGTEVKTAPHLSTQIAFAIKPGGSVTVHGLKAASLPLIQGVSITDDVSGKTVVDSGPGGPGREPPPPPPPLPTVAVDPNGVAVPADASGPAQVQGKVRMALHGMRGEVNGVLMEDGTILRLPPPEAVRFSTLLSAGQTVVAQGDIVESPIAKVVDVRRIGPSSEAMSAIQPPPPPHGYDGRRGPPPA